MTVLVATDDGVDVLEPDGAGPRELDGRPVTVLARDRGAWWAIVEGSTVARRHESGVWSDVAHTTEELTAFLPAPSGGWAGTADGQLLRLFETSFGVNAGFDAVAGRESWKTVGSRVPYVRSITATAGDGAMLASVHVGGIPRSGNGGASWRPTIAPEADVHEVRAHPSDPQLVLAAAAVGLAISRDAGATWTVVTDGLHATYLRAVAFTGDGALVSASDGPFTDRSAIYRCDPDRDGPLTKVEAGLPEWLDNNVDTGALDAHGAVAAFAVGGSLYVSEDVGTTWSVRATGLGRVHAVGVAPGVDSGSM